MISLGPHARSISGAVLVVGIFVMLVGVILLFALPNGSGGLPGGTMLVIGVVLFIGGWFSLRHMELSESLTDKSPETDSTAEKAVSPVPSFRFEYSAL
jgi:hypothetical protein